MLPARFGRTRRAWVGPYAIHGARSFDGMSLWHGLRVDDDAVDDDVAGGHASDAVSEVAVLVRVEQAPVFERTWTFRDAWSAPGPRWTSDAPDRWWARPATTGVSLAQLLERGAGARPPLDLLLAVGAALRRPGLRLLPLRSPSTIALSFDGDVSADGFEAVGEARDWVGAALDADGVERCVLAACMNGAPTVEAAEALSRSFRRRGNADNVISCVVGLGFVGDHGARFDAVAADRGDLRPAILSLVRGLFPDAWRAEQQRRDEVATITAQTLREEWPPKPPLARAPTRPAEQTQKATLRSRLARWVRPR